MSGKIIANRYIVYSPFSVAKFKKENEKEQRANSFSCKSFT